MTRLKKLLKQLLLACGGVDIILNNADQYFKLIMHHQLKMDKLYDILVKGQFSVSKVGLK
jgi:hypothetical protein